MAVCSHPRSLPSLVGERPKDAARWLLPPDRAPTFLVRRFGNHTIRDGANLNRSGLLKLLGLAAGLIKFARPIACQAGLNSMV
jgi:hypothetical protein